MTINLNLRPALTRHPCLDPINKEQKIDPEDRIRALEKLLERIPDSSCTHFELGILYQRDEKEDGLLKAIKEYDIAIQLDQEDKAFPEYHVERGNAYMALREIYQERLCQLTGTNRHADYAKERELLRNAEEEAGNSYLDAQQMDKDNVCVTTTYGMYFAVKKNFDSAIGCFKEVLDICKQKKLKIDKESDDADINRKAIERIEVLAYCNMAVTYWTKGEAEGDTESLSQGVESYDAAIRIDDDFYSAWYDKGCLLDSLEQHELAIATIREAMKRCSSKEGKKSMSLAVERIKAAVLAKKA